MFKGLKGEADRDRDGLITLDETYRYVAKKFLNADGDEQYPVKRGTFERSQVFGNNRLMRFLPFETEIKNISEQQRVDHSDFIYKKS